MIHGIYLVCLCGISFVHPTLDVCDPGYPPETGYCARDCCTNDVEDIYGDEVITWDPISDFAHKDSPADTPNCYEIGQWTLGRDDYDVVGKKCEFYSEDEEGNALYNPPQNWFNMYAVDFSHHPQTDREYYYRVRSCWGPTCSDWSETYVQLIGGEYACWDGVHHCDVPCYENAPLLDPSCQELIP